MADRIELAKGRYEWAVKRAGMTMDEYMRNHPKSAVLSWIDEEKLPTFKQLEIFAKSVNVPLGYLFTKNTPLETIPIPMFRGEAGNGNFNLNVFDTVQQVMQRQNWLEDYLKDNDIETCKFVGSVSVSSAIEEVVAHLRVLLNLTSTWAFEYATPEAAISKLTMQIEEAKVFLLYNGVVGNNTHRQIPVTECRGFALVNEVAPYIYVNSADSKSAQLFTLIHELTHLLIGVSAGYAGEDGYLHDATERFCDSVAAEFLVPANILKSGWNNISVSAKKFKVSELVVARRARDLQLISREDYNKFYRMYVSRAYLKKKSSGGNFYSTSIKRVGRTFAIHVRNAVNNRQLSYTDAYRLTGLYGRTYDSFMNNNI